MLRREFSLQRMDLGNLLHLADVIGDREGRRGNSPNIFDGHAGGQLSQNLIFSKKIKIKIKMIINI